MDDEKIEKAVASVIVTFENGDTIAVDPVYCQISINGTKKSYRLTDGHMFTHNECESAFLQVYKGEAIVWDFNWKMYGGEPYNESPVGRLVGGYNDIICVGFRMVDDTTDIYYVPWKGEGCKNAYEKAAVVDGKIMISVEENEDA